MQHCLLHSISQILPFFSLQNFSNPSVPWWNIHFILLSNILNISFLTSQALWMQGNVKHESGQAKIMERVEQALRFLSPYLSLPNCHFHLIPTVDALGFRTASQKVHVHSPPRLTPPSCSYLFLFLYSLLIEPTNQISIYIECSLNHHTNYSEMLITSRMKSTPRDNLYFKCWLFLNKQSINLTLPWHWLCSIGS